jgi:hypothetical protein
LAFVIVKHVVPFAAVNVWARTLVTTCSVNWSALTWSVLSTDVRSTHLPLVVCVISCAYAVVAALMILAARHRH